jgi:cation diffusion facilitator family transporter
MPERSQLVRRGFHLSIFTVAWNIIEGLVAIVAGLFAGSIALLGFGVDSFVEAASGIVVGWRFSYEMSGSPPEKIEKAEMWAARITGSLLLILAVYLLIDSCLRLLGYGRQPDRSVPGIILTAVSLIIMPTLAKAKLQVAEKVGSRALRADSYESIACAWLSIATLAGLVLNALFHWWWADPAAALAIIPLLAREGLKGLFGESE